MLKKRSIIPGIFLLLAACSQPPEFNLALVSDGVYLQEEKKIFSTPGQPSSAENSYQGAQLLVEEQGRNTFEHFKLNLVRFNDEGDPTKARSIAYAIALGYDPSIFDNEITVFNQKIHDKHSLRADQGNALPRKLISFLNARGMSGQDNLNNPETQNNILSLILEEKNILLLRENAAALQQQAVLIRDYIAVSAPRATASMETAEYKQEYSDLLSTLATLLNTTLAGLFEEITVPVPANPDNSPAENLLLYYAELQKQVYLKLLQYEYALTRNIEGLSRFVPLPADLLPAETPNRLPYLGVIGHSQSICTEPASLIYNHAGIPMISPHSTAVSITRDKEYIFRTVFDNYLQATFMANYALQVLNLTQCLIIYEKHDPYSYDLMQRFAAEWSRSAVPPRLIDLDQFKKGDTITKDFLTREDITALNNGMSLFLATHNAEGLHLLNILTEKRMEQILAGEYTPTSKIVSTILAPDSFSNKAFEAELKNLIRKQEQDGYAKYFREEIYVASPFIFETAGEEAQAFKLRYEEQTGYTPDWESVYSYDTALVFYNAFRELDRLDEETPVETLREEIKNYLSAQTSPSDANKGLTGYNFFDARGNAIKPLALQMYYQGTAIAGMHQFQTLRDLSGASDYFELKAANRIITIDLADPGSKKKRELDLLKTDVVYTGTKFNSISELNILEGTCVLDFDIWFRYRKEFEMFDITDIDFENIQTHFIQSNEAGTISDSGDGPPAYFANLVTSSKNENMEYYKRYHIRYQFQNNFLHKDYRLNNQILGFSFTINKQPKNDLILVTDTLGMESQAKTGAQVASYEESRILASASGWFITDQLQFEDTEKRITHGDPLYLGSKGGSVDFSRYNVAFYIGKRGESVKNQLFANAHPLHLFLALVAFMVLIFIDKRTNRFGGLIYLLQSLNLIIILALAELIIGNGIVATLNSNNPEVIGVFFDVLWWFLYATLIILFIDKFVWRPLEKKTERKVPGFAKIIFAGLILVVTLIGVIAIVFKMQITSLIATSGAIAIIFGIVSKMNLSDIIAGIVINLDTTFRIGDFVEIEGITGEVVDIRWRCTRIRQKDFSIVSIPNQKVSSLKVKNYNYPDPRYSTTTSVSLDVNYHPARMIKLLKDSVLTIEEIMKDPPPEVRLTDVKGGLAVYTITYYLENFKDRSKIDEALWQQILKHLDYAGTSPALPGKAKESPDLEAALPAPRFLLDRVELFAILSTEQKDNISGIMKKRRLAPGELILKQGEQTTSLYIIAEGVVSVEINLEEKGETLEVKRLGTGDLFGEIAFVKDSPRTADIIAHTETLLYELEKAMVFGQLKEEPQVIHQLVDLINRRELEHEEEKERYLNANVVRLSWRKRLFRFILNLLRRLIRRQAITPDHNHGMQVK